MYDKSIMGTPEKGSVGGVALIIGLLVVLVAGYCVWAARRPLPPVQAVESSVKAQVAVPAAKPLSWPAAGQAAVGIAGSSILQ
ncbi:MAG: hypothetical protein ACREJM_06370, partial [Candidatus Saccharimonadales bacterium]